MSLPLSHLSHDVPEIPTVGLPELLGGIRGALDEVEGWLGRQLRPEHRRLETLLAYAGRFRGKRLRAAQVILVGEACGGTRPEHVPVAGIIEMIHAATLIHDDLLDEADQRRGMDCLHVEWGTHTSILLGDWIYARAFQRSTELPDVRCSQVLAEATARICHGEIHQNLTRRDFELSEQDYIAQIDGKTAALYEAGGRLAAHYAGGSPRLQEACARHGLLAGRAFQIIDDVLDLEGDEEVVGKSLGTDWDRGKMTLPLIRLRDSLPLDQRNRLADLFGSGAGRHQLLEGEFAAASQETLAGCKAEAALLLQEASASLGALPESQARDRLRELTDFVGSRRR